MKKYTWILGGLMAMAITACTGDELMQNPERQPAEGEVVTVTAYAPGNNTNSRVEFNESTTQGVSFDLSWSNNDKFSVIMNSSYQTFTKVSNSDNFFSGTYPAGSGTYYAVYPYIASGTASATAVPFDLSTQTGALYASKTYMRATSTDNGQTFEFSHCTAILKATFTGLPDDATIKQIKVITPTNYKVNGTINLTNGTIEGASTNGTNVITIDYSSPIAVNTPVYIYLPPIAAADKHLEFEVAVKEGNEEKLYIGTLDGNTEQDMEAGYLYTASVTLAPDTRTFLLLTNNTGSVQTFTLNKERRVKFSGEIKNPADGEVQIDASLEYSLNSSSWQTWTENIEVPVNGVLRLRGMNPNGTATSISNNFDYLRISISSTGEGNTSSGIACTGDIRALIDWRNYENMNSLGTDVRFCYLFANLTELTSISETLLPATKLSEYCYAGMFSGTGITEIPANLLPATQDGSTSNLGNYCYQYMFKDCTQLTEIPATLLPATRLREYCYAGMFSGTGITYIPEGLLPANYRWENYYSGRLPSSCYYSMFSGCTALGTHSDKPAIPANLLPSDCFWAQCYNEMFARCSNLTVVPAKLLQSTHLEASCYRLMFSDCTSLTVAPELPATTLAVNCYAYMFKGCTSLQTAPTLPATQLVEECYIFMFSGCTSLNSVTMLATGIKQGANNCTKEWLKGVAASGTFTKSAAMSLETGVNGIPEGWTVNVPSDLPSIDNGGEFDDTNQPS